MTAEVVAALIRRGDKFLICRRPANKKRGLLWEFVGGKVEKGETKQEALKRECKEELDVEIAVGEEFFEVNYVYPDLTITLTVFFAEITAGKLTLKEHADVKWITKDEIDNYDFCPADESVLEKIKREF